MEIKMKDGARRIRKYILLGVSWCIMCKVVRRLRPVGGGRHHTTNQNKQTSEGSVQLLVFIKRPNPISYFCPYPLALGYWVTRGGGGGNLPRWNGTPLQEQVMSSVDFSGGAVFSGSTHCFFFLVWVKGRKGAVINRNDRATLIRTCAKRRCKWSWARG